jgi:thioredoxin-dependent peroxiredoxin
MVEEGKPAPDFELETDEGGTVRLSELRGKPVVLYFYPKDDTPGCTRQACAFRDVYSEFQERGAVVLGVSPDSVASHRKFKEKYGLPFPLLADSDHEVADRYGAWREKLVRSTFVIDPDGTVARAMYGVNPEQNAGEVLEAL